VEIRKEEELSLSDPRVVLAAAHLEVAAELWLPCLVRFPTLYL
jgi:hypothetical protein